MRSPQTDRTAHEFGNSLRFGGDLYQDAGFESRLGPHAAKPAFFEKAGILRGTQKHSYSPPGLKSRRGCHDEHVYDFAKLAVVVLQVVEGDFEPVPAGLGHGKERLQVERDHDRLSSGRQGLC